MVLVCFCVCMLGLGFGGKNLFLDADAPPCGGPWSSFPAATKVEYKDNDVAGGDVFG